MYASISCMNTWPGFRNGRLVMNNSIDTLLNGFLSDNVDSWVGRPAALVRNQLYITDGDWQVPNPEFAELGTHAEFVAVYI